MKKTITLEQINKYNQMVTASIGTDAYNKLALPYEYREDDTKRWIKNPYNYLYTISVWEDGAEYYIKTVCGTPYLYMDLEGEPSDRYCLENRQIACLFFGI